MSAKTKKANRANGTSAKPRSLSEQFRSVAETYHTDDPEIIKQTIMWRYISMLAHVQVQPGTRPHLPYHEQHFEICNRYIEHQNKVYETMRGPEKRLAEINALIVELHRLFADDFKDNCRRLLDDARRLDYALLHQQIIKLYGTIK